MRSQLLLPKVKPMTFTLPTTCPRPRCPGTHFRERQEVTKAVRDTVHQQVVARRYECLRCHRTFRVYPLGVTKAQVSLRVKGLAVMFYVLGLSYGAVSLVLDALGVYVCKSRVYDVVQAAAQGAPGLKRQ